MGRIFVVVTLVCASFSQSLRAQLPANAINLAKLKISHSIWQRGKNAAGIEPGLDFQPGAKHQWHAKLGSQGLHQKLRRSTHHGHDMSGVLMMPEASQGSR